MLSIDLTPIIATWVASFPMVGRVVIGILFVLLLVVFLFWGYATERVNNRKYAQSLLDNDTEALVAKFVTKRRDKRFVVSVMDKQSDRRVSVATFTEFALAANFVKTHGEEGIAKLAADRFAGKHLRKRASLRKERYDPNNPYKNIPKWQQYAVFGQRIDY